MIQKWKLHIGQLLRQLRFRLSASNNFLFINFYRFLYNPPKNSLSAFLDYYSSLNKDDFYVVQIGANDGITHDPIHKFIKRDRWKGILLEPQSYVHDTFLKKIYSKNTGIYTLNAALGYQDGVKTLYKIGFCHMRWATGLATFRRDQLEKAFSEGLVQKQCQKYGIVLPSEYEWIKEEQVQVISPATMIQQFNINKIDLLQIDVEGFDFEVIKMFDIRHSRPGAIVYEHVHLSEEDQKECEEHLKLNHYRSKKYGANTLAIHKDLTELDRFF